MSFREGKVVTGDDEVIRILKALPSDLEKKALRPALRHAAKMVILPAAKQNLREQQEGGTGHLLRQLKVRAIKRSRTKLGAAVALRNDKGGTETFYGLFLEYGLTKTSPPRRHRSGKSTGDLPAMPFLRPALYDNEQKIKRITISAIKRWIATFKSTGKTSLAGKAVRAG